MTTNEFDVPLFKKGRYITIKTPKNNLVGRLVSDSTGNLYCFWICWDKNTNKLKHNFNTIFEPDELKKEYFRYATNDEIYEYLKFKNKCRLI